MPTELNGARDLLERTLSLAKNGGASAAECLWLSSCSRSFSVCDDELEKSRTSFSSTLGLRVLDRKGRQGVACLTDLDENASERLCDMAFLSARYAAVEDDVVFPEVQPQISAEDLGVYDPQVPEWTPEDQIALCMSMSRQARELDLRVKKVRTAALDTAWGESLMLNSNGVEIYRRSTAGGIGVALIAEDGGASEIGGAGFDGRSRASLMSTLPVKEAVEHTVRNLHGVPLRTGRYTLVLEPEVTASLLAAVSELFSAANVCKGLSLLAGKMGQQVASESLTLVDDGRLHGGLGTSFCDSEAVSTRRTVVLERGKLSSWLCNLQYGRRLGLPSTGNGSRGPSSLPDVDVTNFFVKPGVRPWEEIVAMHDGCFCVTELMGLHTIDTVTGDFSLAARGLYYKDGNFSPVSSVTIAGTLGELLGKVTEVGSDLRFYDRFGGCTLVVDDIVVAGA